VRTLAADPQNIFNPGKIGLWGTGTRDAQRTLTAMPLH
jgi:hypothetical protein